MEMFEIATQEVTSDAIASSVQCGDIVLQTVGLTPAELGEIADINSGIEAVNAKIAEAKVLNGEALADTLAKLDVELTEATQELSDWAVENNKVIEPAKNGFFGWGAKDAFIRDMTAAERLEATIVKTYGSQYDINSLKVDGKSIVLDVKDIQL